MPGTLIIIETYIRELISEENVDGALVGGASLKADSFTQIIKGCL